MLLLIKRLISRTQCDDIHHLGRWSLRNNLTRDLITVCDFFSKNICNVCVHFKSSPFELYRLLEDPKYEKGPLEMLSPELFAVPYKSHSDFVESHDKYNIVVCF